MPQPRPAGHRVLLGLSRSSGQDRLNDFKGTLIGLAALAAHVHLVTLILVRAVGAGGLAAELDELHVLAVAELI